MVFADGWGRPSSLLQRLVERLSDRYPTLWVNTVGSGRRMSGRGTVSGAWARLRQWAGLDTTGAQPPESVVVANPILYPDFRTGWQRRFNTWQMAKTVQRLASRPGWREDAAPAYPRLDRRRAGLTTMPITADLVAHSHRLGIDRWVYYCVDNPAAWPGPDGQVMAAMEFQLALDADVVVCASEHLRQRLASMGRDDARLLTPGIGLEEWSSSRPPERQGREALAGTEPTYLFFGLIDARLDMTWCLALGSEQPGSVWLAGPMQPGFGAQWWQVSDSLRFTGEVSSDQLPGLAIKARVLVMPYADAVLTRAMPHQRLVEYLAVGWPDAMRPVVARDLPSTRAWSDCCDLAATPEQFVRLCRERAATGLPAPQREARLRRLPGESWSHKAAELEAMLTGPIAGRGSATRHAAAERSIRPLAAA